MKDACFRPGHTMVWSDGRPTRFQSGPQKYTIESVHHKEVRTLSGDFEIELKFWDGLDPRLELVH